MAGRTIRGLMLRLGVIALALGIGTSAFAETISEITIEGLRRVDKEGVLEIIGSKVGAELNAAQVTEDIETVWKKNFFRDIQVYQEKTAEGVRLVWVIEEKPSIRRIRYEGIDGIGESDVKDVVDIKVGMMLDRARVTENANKIRDVYLEKGYFLVDVEGDVKLSEDGFSAEVTFQIIENEKVMVRSLDLVGNKAILDSEIKPFLQTKEATYISTLALGGTYREEFFQTDLMRIQALYYDKGFVSVKVDQPVVRLAPDRKSIYITIPVSEGVAYSVGDVFFGGDFKLASLPEDEQINEEQLRRFISLEGGEVFSRTKLFEDIQRVTNAYKNRGYAYANVIPNSGTREEDRLVDIEMVVEPGELVYIERVDIRGNTRTRDKVIRRESRIYEGDLYAEYAIEATRARIFQLGYFETVDVTTSPGSSDDQIRVVIEVKEKSTGTFQVGMGFSSIESFIATAQISQNNFLGTGRNLSLSAQLSFGDFGRKLATVQFYEPYFLDSYWALGLNGFITQRYYRDFIRNSTGISPSLGYPLTPDLRVSLGYTVENLEITSTTSGIASGSALDILSADGINSAVSANVSYDTRDNRLFPTSGHYYLLSSEISDRILGSDEDLQFTRFGFTGRYYYPLPLSFVLKLNSEIGYVFGREGNRVPISERYFPGGIYSVRGFAPRSLGPRLEPDALSLGDPLSTGNNFVIGGNKQAIFNLELEVPLFAKAGIKGVVFFDAGNAYNDDENFFYIGDEDSQVAKGYNFGSSELEPLPLGLYMSAGFGFRWVSPIGPLRFEWGLPLTKQRVTDEDLLFEFTIGNMF